MKGIYPLIFFFLFLPMVAWAKNLSQLYDQATLQYWGTRYPDNIRYNFSQVILPNLPSELVAPMAGVQLRFPLVGEREGDPLEYYAGSYWGQPAITLPILSIKFLDDIAIAYAWLWTNGYSVETVTDYITLLKYAAPGEFPGGRYAPPLQALNIPADALNDPDVDSLSQKILKSALVWVMAHELAHIRYQHPGYGPEVSALQAQRNEEQADRFATDVMRRIGVAPLGMANFMTIAVHWWANRGDFSSEEAWNSYLETTTHPLTSQRLKLMARDIRQSAEDFARKEANYQATLLVVRKASEDIENIADILDNPTMQRFLRARKDTLVNDPRALRPRRP